MSVERAIGFGIVLIGTVITFAVGSPVRAADWDTSTGSGASNAYSEFDLDSTNHTSAEQNIGGIASSGSAGSSGVLLSAANVSQPRPVQVASRRTIAQQVRLAPATTAILDRTFGRLHFLPPTSMESFVRNSAGNADLIYGDEGTDGPPPFEGFDESHRIDRGIYTPGLTTGHKSLLPSAWGYPN